MSQLHQDDDEAERRAQTEAYEAFVRFAIEPVAGLSLVQADRVLDDARRLCWYSVFSGDSDEAVAKHIEPHPMAVVIAGRLRGLMLPQVASVLESARIFLWSQVFKQIPGSNFGKAMSLDAAPSAKPH